MYLFCYAYSDLIRKFIQIHLIISIQHSKMDPFCEPTITQIFPKMHGLGIKFSGVILPDPHCGRGRPTPARGPVRHPPDAEHKSALWTYGRGPFWNLCTRAHCNLATPLGSRTNVLIMVTHVYCIIIADLWEALCCSAVDKPSLKLLIAVQTHASHSIAFNMFSTLWHRPCDLNLWPFELKTVSLLRYSKVISYTEFEDFGIIRFWVMLRTNKQTQINALSPVSTTRVDSPWTLVHFLTPVNSGSGNRALLARAVVGDSNKAHVTSSRVES